MNKRIQELIKQADGEYYTGFMGSPNTYKFTESRLEKFAELIINEIANFVDYKTSTDARVEGKDILDYFRENL